MPSTPIRRIAICTGGGDAPGLNAVIRAVVIAAVNRGWECYGIRDGFNGILFPERYVDGGVLRLTRERVHGIGHLGGTMLGTTNKGNPFHFPTRMPDGSVRDLDRSDEILEYFGKKEIDALVSVGGDGSLTIADALHKKGLRVVGVPKTIDNDLDKTMTTFGFDTAVSFATDCLDRLHSTAESHHRLMVVEVMGRYAGWIALHSGIAGNAHAILLPEIPSDLDIVASHILAREAQGHPYSVVVVAEGAAPAMATPSCWLLPKSAMLSVLVAWANMWPRPCRNVPEKMRASWCWGTCCAVVAPPPLTAWRPCVLVQRRFVRWMKA